MDGIHFARDMGWHSEHYSQGVHAPKGGVSIKGTFYPGGQFIPGDVVASASPDVKQKLKPTRKGMEAVARKDKEYTHADEKELPEDFRARVKSLRLPPAWTGVQVSSDPNSDLQAVGYDQKGRVQYRYSDAHNKRQSAAKFERVKKFVGQLGNIRKQIDATLSGPDGPDKEAAAVLALIDRTGFRVGSDRDTQAEKRAHGATTLEADHVSVNGESVTFSFTGKKGVDIKQTVKSPSLARMISERKARGGRLFSTTDGQVREYLHRVGGKFKVKDFRTAVAADTAMTAIKGLQEPKNEKEYKLRRAEVGKIVADKLGNTATVALASYIPPEVFAPWQANLISQNPSAKTSGSSSKPAATQKTSTGKRTGGTTTKQPTIPTTRKSATAQAYAKRKTTSGWITIGGDKSAPPGDCDGSGVSFAESLGWDIDEAVQFSREMGWVERYTEHAAEGGETVDGKEYKGGQFVPGEGGGKVKQKSRTTSNKQKQNRVPAKKCVGKVDQQSPTIGYKIGPPERDGNEGHYFVKTKGNAAPELAFKDEYGNVRSYRTGDIVRKDIVSSKPVDIPESKDFTRGFPQGGSDRFYEVLLPDSNYTTIVYQDENGDFYNSHFKIHKRQIQKFKDITDELKSLSS